MATPGDAGIRRSVRRFQFDVAALRRKLNGMPGAIRDYMFYQGAQAAARVVRAAGRRKNFAFRDVRGITRKSFRVIAVRRDASVAVAYGGRGGGPGKGAYQATLIEFGTRVAPPKRALERSFESTVGAQREAAIGKMRSTFASVVRQVRSGRYGTDLATFARHRGRRSDD